MQDSFERLSFESATEHHFGEALVRQDQYWGIATDACTIFSNLPPEALWVKVTNGFHFGIHLSPSGLDLVPDGSYFLQSRIRNEDWTNQGIRVERATVLENEGLKVPGYSPDHKLVHLRDLEVVEFEPLKEVSPKYINYLASSTTALTSPTDEQKDFFQAARQASGKFEILPTPTSISAVFQALGLNGFLGEFQDVNANVDNLSSLHFVAANLHDGISINGMTSIYDFLHDITPGMHYPGVMEVASSRIVWDMAEFLLGPEFCNQLTEVVAQSDIRATIQFLSTHTEAVDKIARIIESISVSASMRAIGAKPSKLELEKPDEALQILGIKAKDEQYKSIRKKLYDLVDVK